MATMFFTSWALWEKLSFVLALTILVVFGIAYGNLLRTNRIIRKRESQDEERHLAIEESGQSSQVVEAGKSQDMPFGVRAIQSGIQVNGIWTPRDATPVPSSLKLSHMRDSSSDRSGNQSPSSRVSQDSSQVPVHSILGRGRTTPRESESGSFLADQLSKSTEVQDGRGYRPEYQPRRSSHLRYDSNGELSHQEEALDPLETKSAFEVQRGLAKRNRGLELENDTPSGAAADNERSSGSETDATLSSSTKIRTYGQRQSLPVQYIGGKSLLKIAKVASRRSPRTSLPKHSSEASYPPIYLEPPENERLDPSAASTFEVVDTSLPFKPPSARTARELSTSGESKIPLLTRPRSPSPFIPAELHMNKSVRRVNSGFEVLPAGTFGVLQSSSMN